MRACVPRACVTVCVCVCVCVVGGGAKPNVFPPIKFHLMLRQHNLLDGLCET